MQEEENPDNAKEQPKPSGVGAAAKNFFGGVVTSLTDTLKPQKSIPTKPLHEVLPGEVEYQYSELSKNEALKTYLFRDIPANNAIITQPLFCSPLDAYLVSRCPALWSKVNPFRAKVATSAEKDEMTKLASISPLFFLKSLAPEKFGVEFDQMVVAAFASDTIVNYFLNSNRGRLHDDYVNFVQSCALFLPAAVQGEALCTLMCAIPLPDGSRPIQDAVFANNHIVDRYVLFQYAIKLERLIERMQGLQAELAASPEKTFLKRVTNKAKGVSNQDAVFNRERKIFAKFLGDRLLRYLSAHLGEKTVFDLKDNTQEEFLNWASYAEHYIYQLILKVQRLVQQSDVTRDLVIEFFQKHFDYLLFGKDKEEHLLLDFQRKCDQKYKPELAQFDEIAKEIKLDFGFNLLVDQSKDPRVLGLQELFNGRNVSPTLGVLLLSNASPAQLVQVTSRFPNAGLCFWANPLQLFKPLIDWVAKHSDEIDLDGVRQVFAGCDRDVFIHLDASHFATLIAINPDKCIASIATYLQNVRHDPGLCLKILGNDMVTPAAANLMLREFDGKFIRDLSQRVVKDIDASPDALVKLLLCQSASEVHAAISKLLKKSHAKVFEMFDVRYCNQDVIRHLEDILLKNLTSKGDLFDVIEHISKYLLCKRVVESEKNTFFELCRRDNDMIKAVIVAVQEDRSRCVSSPAREWVVPFLCKLIAAVDEKVLMFIGLDIIHALFAQDVRIAQVLLGRKTIAEALEKSHKLTHADWQIMMDSLVNHHGQELLTSDILQKELVVRLGNGINANTLRAKPQVIDGIFADERLGRMVLMHLNHRKRVLLFNFAQPPLLTQLFRLFDHDLIRAKLFEVLACCLREITNEVFFELAFADQTCLEFVIQSAAHQRVLQDFITANEGKHWVRHLIKDRVHEQDVLLAPVALQDEESQQELVSEDVHYHDVSETEDVTDGLRGSEESSPRRPDFAALPVFSVINSLSRAGSGNDVGMRIISSKNL